MADIPVLHPVSTTSASAAAWRGFIACILSTTHLDRQTFRSRPLDEPLRVVCANVTYRSADGVNRADSVVACPELNLCPRTSSTNAANPQLEKLDPMHAERSFALQLASAFIASFALLVASPTSGIAQTVVAAAASDVGIAGFDDYKPPLSRQQTAVIQMVQQTAPVQQAPVQHPVRVPETVLDKQNKLAAMEAYDQQLLAADGYRATARLDYGKCNGGPPTRLVDPGLHYHSTSTCIEYAAVVTSGAKAGQHVHIYVQHHGVPDDITDTKFTAVEGPALPAN